MSKKSSRRPVMPPAQPRQLSDIEASYNQVKANLADAQYLAYIYTKEVERLSQEMLRLNQEGAARKNLDQAVPKPVEATIVEETVNVNS